uniref:Uncharacterized protein n=1 Tax=Arundo donax TaxID=35708 RepID=A0A0A8YPP4_ARUDO
MDGQDNSTQEASDFNCLAYFGSLSVCSAELNSLQTHQICNVT